MGVCLMETKPTENERLDKFLQDQILAVKLLWDARLFIPILMLLYATIDIIAFVRTGGSDKDAGPRFKEFADTYIVNQLSGITKDDLWSARCAILHTGTPESSNSKKGKAREISYCWGSANIEKLNKINEKETDKYTAMSVEDFMSALGNGLDKFLEDMEKDQNLCKACLERVGKFYAHVPVGSK
jgi:hypothetical protein